MVFARILVGLIVLICAGVFSGASLRMGLWHPWTLLLTYWLYFAHFIFLTTLAVRTGRTSLSSLYLWGVLYGLYESWITRAAFSTCGGAKTNFSVGWQGAVSLIYNRAGLFDEKLFYEDWDIWLRIAHCFGFAYSDRVSAKYRVTSTSIVRAQFNRIVQSVSVLAGAGEVRALRSDNGCLTPICRGSRSCPQPPGWQSRRAAAPEPLAEHGLESGMDGRRKKRPPPPPSPAQRQ